MPWLLYLREVSPALTEKGAGWAPELVCLIDFGDELFGQFQEQIVYFHQKVHVVTMLVVIKYLNSKVAAQVICNGMPSCQSPRTVLAPGHVGLREKLFHRFPAFSQCIIQLQRLSLQSLSKWCITYCRWLR
jgi:hypothetical protein